MKIPQNPLLHHPFSFSKTRTCRWYMVVYSDNIPLSIPFVSQCVNSSQIHLDTLKSMPAQTIIFTGMLYN